MAYVTSDMACNEPNSATPMSQARINAQNNRVAKVGNSFTSGNKALDDLVTQLGGIGIGNPPGTTPRAGAPDFRNAPSCNAGILPGGLYGARVPIPGAGTGQPLMTSEGLVLPSLPPGSPQPNTNPWIDPDAPNPGQLAVSPVQGGSSPSAGPAIESGVPDSAGWCQPPGLSLASSSVDWTPFLWGGLIFIVGFGVLTGGNK